MVLKSHGPGGCCCCGPCEEIGYESDAQCKCFDSGGTRHDMPTLRTRLYGVTCDPSVEGEPSCEVDETIDIECSDWKPGDPGPPPETSLSTCGLSLEWFYKHVNVGLLSEHTEYFFFLTSYGHDVSTPGIYDRKKVITWSIIGDRVTLPKYRNCCPDDPLADDTVSRVGCLGSLVPFKVGPACYKYNTSTFNWDLIGCDYPNTHWLCDLSTVGLDITAL